MLQYREKMKQDGGEKKKMQRCMKNVLQDNGKYTAGQGIDAA